MYSLADCSFGALTDETPLFQMTRPSDCSIRNASPYTEGDRVQTPVTVCSKYTLTEYGQQFQMRSVSGLQLARHGHRSA